MPASDRDLTHAYANLGLRADATEAEVRAAYLAAVKRWHPDRFQADSAGAAEANTRLRLANQAYETISAVAPAVPAVGSLETSTSEDHARALTNDEKAAIVAALKAETAGAEGGFTRSVMHAGAVGVLWLALPPTYSYAGWTLASGVLGGRNVLIPLVAGMWMRLGVRVFGWLIAIFGMVFLPLVIEIAARLSNGGPLP